MSSKINSKKNELKKENDITNYKTRSDSFEFPKKNLKKENDNDIRDTNWLSFSYWCVGSRH
jgi:hypothetical protein